MQTVCEDMHNGRGGEIRRKNDDMNLKVLLFSPIKDIASWLNLPDKQMPSLEEVSPQSRSDVDMTPSTSTISQTSMEHDIVPATPKASTSPENNNFDPLRDIVNFFSPRLKHAESSEHNEVSNTAARVRHASNTPRKEEQPKRLDFDVVVVNAPPAALSPIRASREVATIQDLLMDTRKGLEKMVATAKDVNMREWLDKARQLDTKEWAQSARTSTQKTAKKVEGQMIKIVDSAKEIEPKQLLKQAKVSAKELAESVSRNAKAHPLPWAVIAIVVITIFAHVLLFSGSVGTPAMRFWRFSIKMHTSPNIVERVGYFLQTEMGEEAKQILESTKSTSSCAAVSGQDILMRLSHSIFEPVLLQPDLVDVVVEQIDMIRENPREYLKLALSSSQNFVSDIWQRGHQLTSDTFDELTAL